MYPLNLGYLLMTSRMTGLNLLPDLDIWPLIPLPVEDPRFPPLPTLFFFFNLCCRRNSCNCIDLIIVDEVYPFGFPSSSSSPRLRPEGGARFMNCPYLVELHALYINFQSQTPLGALWPVGWLINVNDFIFTFIAVMPWRLFWNAPAGSCITGHVVFRSLFSVF